MSASRKRKRRRPRQAGARSPVASGPDTAKPKPDRAAALEERPPAPWGSFPLVELAVLIGLVLLVIGFFADDPGRRNLFIGTGIALAAVGGLELSIREHFSGFRSHSTLLAGTAGIATLALLVYAGPESLPALGRLAIAVAVFAGAFALLTRAFRRRAGVAFKLR